MTEMIKRLDPDDECIQQALDHLEERFETIQIVVTKHDAVRNGTDILARGRGNMYARIGSVEEWLKMQDENRPCDYEVEWDDGETQAESNEDDAE